MTALAATPDWLVQLRGRFAGIGLSRLGLASLGLSAPRHARIVQSLALGPGSRLLVVEFDGQRLLIGQARGGLVRLGETPAAMP